MDCKRGWEVSAGEYWEQRLHHGNNSLTEGSGVEWQGARDGALAHLKARLHSLERRAVLRLHRLQLPRHLLHHLLADLQGVGDKGGDGRHWAMESVRNVRVRGGSPRPPRTPHTHLRLHTRHAVLRVFQPLLQHRHLPRQRSDLVHQRFALPPPRLARLAQRRLVLGQQLAAHPRCHGRL